MTFNAHLLLAFALALPLACKGSKHQSDDKSGKDDETEPADPPAEVSGAFLTMAVKCAPFSPAVDLGNPSYPNEILGCVLEDATGKRYDGPLADIGASVTLVDGRVLTPKVSPTDDSIGWHIGFEVPKSDAATVKRIETTGTGGADRFRLATTDATYDWTNDPAFGAAWLIRANAVLFRLLHKTGGPHCELPERFLAKPMPPRTWPLPAELLAKPYQFVFVSSGVYDASIGVDGADKLCAALGAKIDTARTWKAALSTSKEHAQDRVPVKGPVFGTNGYLVAPDADAFWRPASVDTTGFADNPILAYPNQLPPPEVAHWSTHYSMVYDECGLPPGDLNNADVTLDLKVVSIWTGTTQGVFNAAIGACKDWTSAAPEDRGVAGRTYGWVADFFDRDNGGETCAQQSHLLCMSL